MKHPFSGSDDQQTKAEESTENVGNPERRNILRVGAAGTGALLLFGCRTTPEGENGLLESQPRRTSRRRVEPGTTGATTEAVGEEGGDFVSTEAVGEEGGGWATSMAVGEEGGGVATRRLGEDGGDATTLAVDEDGATTRRLSEEGGATTERSNEEGGGVFTSQALGEEGGNDWVSTQAVGEEGGGVTRALYEDGAMTEAVGEDGSGHVTTRRLNEEGGGNASTQAVGEEGGWFTTRALNEEGGGGGNRPGPIYSTRALGEEGGGGRVTTMAVNEEGGRDGGGRVSTQAVGEEGGSRGSNGGGGTFTSMALGEEAGRSGLNLADSEPRLTTMALGEEGGDNWWNELNATAAFHLIDEAARSMAKLMADVDAQEASNKIAVEKRTYDPKAKIKTVTVNFEDKSTDKLFNQPLDVYRAFFELNYYDATFVVSHVVTWRQGDGAQIPADSDNTFFYSVLETLTALMSMRGVEPQKQTGK